MNDVTNKRGNHIITVGLEPYYTKLYFDKYLKLDPASIGEFLAPSRSQSLPTMSCPITNSSKHVSTENGRNRSGSLIVSLRSSTNRQ